jgi:hypothetical protein
MPNKALNEEDVARLKKVLAEGCQVLQEVDDLKAGLSDTVKAIAEEMDIKPANLNKAIKLAHKANFTEAKADLDEVEDILDITGRKV